MKRTPEEIKAWREKMTGLARQIHAMTAQEKEALAIRIGGIVTCEGRTLSLHNTMMLYLQAGAGCTMIGGFRQWQKAGRCVKAGEHAAGYIYVPMIRKSTNETDGEGGPEDASAELRFRLVPVFDLAQTQEAQARAA